MTVRRPKLFSSHEWLLPRRRDNDPTDLADSQARRDSAVYRYTLLVLSVLLAPINVHNVIEGYLIPALGGLSLLLLFVISIYQISRRRKPLMPPFAALGASLAILILSVYYGQTYQLYWIYPLLVALPILLKLRVAVWLALASGAAVAPLILQQFEPGTSIMIILSMAHTWLIAGGMMYAASEHNRKLQVLVNLDPLTGLQNRRHLPTELARQWQRWSQQSQRATLMMMDMDHFKALNDGHGHAAGDHALQAVAGILQQRLRQSDACFRYGGEEFLVILSGTGLTEAILVAEDLRRRIEGLEIQPDLPLTVSIGLCECSQVTSPEQWQLLADKALQQAKTTGRNRVAVAGEADGAKPVTSAP